MLPFVSKQKNSKLGVFAILNLVNKKVFVGTGDLYSRKAINWSLLRASRHNNQRLQQDWNNYGEDNFRFVHLFECETTEDVKYLTKCEKEWIKLTQSTEKRYGYNIYKRACVRHRNFVVSFEMTEKMID